MKRYAFTMLELVFVIVVMGILGKFGVEFLANAYNSFIFSKVNNTLQSNSAMAIEVISKRLEHRIKDSIIARKNNGSFDPLASVDPTTATDYKILEWVGSDIDGFRGTSGTPHWSGIADIEVGNASSIISPSTNTSSINSFIQILANTSTTTIDNAAIYFIGSTSDVRLDYGWAGNGSYLQDQNGSMHPIQDTLNLTELIPKVAGTTFPDIYEYYKLAWTAYAVVLSADGNLTLHSNYQPWEGESYTAATKQDLIMQNVDTFQFMALGSIVKVQVCVKTDLVEDYSLCKEKTIY